MSSVLIYPLYNFFLDSVSLKKYVVKLLIVALLYLILFLVCIRLKTHSDNGGVEVGRVWRRKEVPKKLSLKFLLISKIFTSNQKLHHFIDKYGFKEVF